MKLLFSFATIFMFLGFTVGSYGDNHSIQAFVYVTSKQTDPLAVGDQMHLNIQISGGKSVSGYEMIVGFDPTALRYIEGANADYLPAGAFTIPPIVTENAVYMTATSGAEVAAASEGTLATLTFEVIAAKDSTIKLMDVILSDSAGMPLAVTVRNGRIMATELPTNWDVNEDGKVNILDLTLVASDLNVDAPANPRVDVNRDGNVNILDLVLVAQNLDAGSNEDKPELRVKLVVPTFASLVSAIPASGDLAFNGSITVTFSSDPGDVTASAGTVSGSGKVRTIAGPFTLGALSLTITWTNGDGSHTLTYNVTAPDTKAPTITGGTISDGAEDVDPEPLNADGIEVIFSEDVSGNIALQTEAGDDVGWIGRVEGTKGTLEPVVGKEIGNETTYVIKGKVFDAVGNETDVSITFTTKGKE
ncbi:hypothetical protein C6503_26050 [Candidatus Poribacteria bacterium]|nr:MAG: hypothetical protein C6503_26050 [Candidatus Poribacteria bacterium]